MVIGTHFYQTHPSFINEFREDKNTHFMLNTSGVYHPKIFLFHNSPSKWECLVGSANFTKSAFTINSEIMTLISSSDIGAEEFFKATIKQIDQYWEQSEFMTLDDYIAYKNVWDKKQKTIKILEGKYGSSSPNKVILRSKIFSLSWMSYLELVKKDPFHSFENRLVLLQEARLLFTSHEHFNEMSDTDRKKIAGFHFDEQPSGFTWAWFGSMKGAGYFKNKINNNNINVSLALDAISLTETISKKDFNQFVKIFKQAFPDGGAGIAVATRLLAMKRPDTFICLDSRNKVDLCNEFGISKTVSFEQYWEEIILRIQDSVWWDSQKPENKIELQLWNGRAAMLDAVFYDENV